MISRVTQVARVDCVTKVVVLCAATVLMAVPLEAHAASIIGDIIMSGNFVPTGGAGLDLSDATGLDFIGDEFNVSAATGVFAAAGISPGDVGVMNDFQFNPLTPSPVDPLWSIAGFSFVMDNVSVMFQDSFFLILEGSGIMTAAGFDDSPGTWRFSANQAGTLFNFSSGLEAVGREAVPEPSTSFLLGLALAGIAFFRRLS